MINFILTIQISILFLLHMEYYPFTWLKSRKDIIVDIDKNPIDAQQVKYQEYLNIKENILRNNSKQKKWDYNFKNRDQNVIIKAKQVYLIDPKHMLNWLNLKESFTIRSISQPKLTNRSNKTIQTNHSIKIDLLVNQSQTSLPVNRFRQTSWPVDQDSRILIY